jgi:endonuclease YncB( thermonuclease family)
MHRLLPLWAPLVLALIAGAASAEPIVGKARVIEGDIIEINRLRIRLFGIDAPEPGQTCLAGGSPWACGQNATFGLSAIMERQWVHCSPQTGSTAERIVAVCRLAGDNGPDIAAGMVRQGWALAYPPGSGTYTAEERLAQKAKSGIWVGRFVTPWDWRQGKRLSTPATR